MSSSPRHDVWRYIWTRFPPWLAGGLSLFIWAGTLPAIVAAPVESAISLIVAVLLIFEFRLWDDLCDRERDRQDHPQRVLCQTNSLGSFVVLAWAMAVLSLGLVASLRPWWSVAIFVALHAIFALWYSCRERLRLGPVLNYHLVLLKYPAFVLLLGAGSRADFALPLFLSMSVVYLVLCVLEVLHDAGLRRLRAAWVCLSVESLVLAGVWTLALGLARTAAFADRGSSP